MVVWDYRCFPRGVPFKSVQIIFADSPYRYRPSLIFFVGLYIKCVALVCLTGNREDLVCLTGNGYTSREIVIVASVSGMHEKNTEQHK